MLNKKIVLLFLLLGLGFSSYPKKTKFIDGTWDFYWKKLYTSSDFAEGVNKKPAKVTIPASWTTYSTQNGKLPPEGFATYRKIVQVDSKSKKNGLKIPLIWSSSRVYVNGQEVSVKGQFTESGKQEEAEMLMSLVDLSFVEGNELEIIVHVVNEEFFLAGIYSDFIIGDYQGLMQEYNISNTLYLALLGGLTVMAIYHLVLYFFRKKGKAALYFTLLAFLMIIRTIVFGEHYGYEFVHTVLGLSLKIQANLYYISTYLMIITGLWYVKSLYPSEANFLLIKYYTWTMLAVCLYIALFPIKFVFANIVFIAPLFALGALYLAYILILAIIKKRKQFILQIIGISILLLAGINDILFLQRIELTGIAESIPMGFALFLLIQMIIIARDFSSTYTAVEELTYNLEQKVLERTSKLNQQRKELKVRNERINESIDYASKIQSAMLPAEDLLKEKFPESFVFYQPKDVLSGDFYFVDDVVYKGNECSVVVAADCTGHGIPGAMMSMMGNTLLKRLLEREKDNDPGHILTKLDQSIQEALKQAETDNHDGMDISVAYIDKKNKSVHFAAANSYIAFVKDGKLSTVRGENSGVGGVKDKEVIFSTRSIEWDQNLQIYQFSDGFQDQFGGSKGKKFQKGKFHQLLKDISGLKANGQYESIVNSFSFWKGNNEQVDDILVIGVQLS